MKKLFVVVMVLPALVTLVQAGDFNGDGTADIGIFRPSTGLWAIRGVTRVYFGSSFDQPVPADYSGNGVDEIAVYRPSSGLWAIRGVTRVYFGSGDDIPLNAVGGSSTSSSGFPTPDYDSGWRGISPGSGLTLPHNLGGNTDNYIVDLQLRSSKYGVHAICLSNDYTCDSYGCYSFGCYWKELTTSSITIAVQPDTNKYSNRVEQARVRIWIYN